MVHRMAEKKIKVVKEFKEPLYRQGNLRISDEVTTVHGCDKYYLIDHDLSLTLWERFKLWLNS